MYYCSIYYTPPENSMDFDASLLKDWAAKKFPNLKLYIMAVFWPIFEFNSIFESYNIQFLRENKDFQKNLLYLNYKIYMRLYSRKNLINETLGKKLIQWSYWLIQEKFKKVFLIDQPNYFNLTKSNIWSWRNQVLVSKFNIALQLQTQTCLHDYGRHLALLS